LNSSNQDDILRYLLDESTWGGQVPSRVDTHVSTVILVGDRAYKLKKAVRFPFLDFSTLDLRKASCERELELNALWAPDLYLGLAEVTRDRSGRLALNGDGETVEYAVAMRRFPDDGGLETVLSRGQVDRKQWAGLVQTVWNGYRKALVCPNGGGAAGMAAIVDGLEQSFAPDPPAELFALWRADLATLAPRLNDRRDAGLVRRCHGDLHLGNICLFQGALLPFDALEFDETLATTDIVYDLAFLIMDLLAHGYSEPASVVMNRYLDLSGDYGAMAVLPFFLSVRAGVRAMVMRAMNDRGRSGVYLKLAGTIRTPQTARIVAVGGLSGSGKSRLSSRLSPLLGGAGAAVIRSDSIRKRLMGVDQTVKLDQSGYEKAVTERVYATLYAACERIAADGFPVIADAVFGRPEERQAIEAAANRIGVPFQGIWLDAPFQVAAQRISGRTGDASDATEQVLARQHRQDPGDIRWARIDTDIPGERTVAAALAALDERRCRL